MPFHKVCSSNFAVGVVVIDANILRAASNDHPSRRDEAALGVCCRRCLESIRENNVKIRVCPILLREYSDHASRFSQKWLTAMLSSNRVNTVSEQDLRTRLNSVRAEISAHYASSVEQRREADKDAHLLALGWSNARILSLDTKAKQLFSSLPIWISIEWVNPCPSC